MFQFSGITPWGKNLEESSSIFSLTAMDMEKKMIAFADGASSLNCELTRMGKSFISLDPMYGLPTYYLRGCLDQALNQSSLFIKRSGTKHQPELEEIERTRERTANLFLDDYESGKKEGRYIQHSLPETTGFADLTFDIGLCSNFILLYEELGVDFHLAALTEMLRICREIRIFPVVNHFGHASAVLPSLTDFFQRSFKFEYIAVHCGYAPHPYDMLKISRF